MKSLAKLAAVATLTLSVTGCSETLGALALGGTAISAFMTSGSANPDYTKYADICRAIIGDLVTLRTSRHQTIQAAFNSNNAFLQGGAIVMLAKEDKDDAAIFSRCALQGPESFLQTIFKNTNVANLILALYQENRADSRAQRLVEVQRQLGLAQMEHAETMQELENSLLTDLAGRPADNFKAGVEAARPVVTPTAP